MNKEDVVIHIKKHGLVAVIRAENEDVAQRIVYACIEGGVRCVEIAFTVPGAHRLLSALRSCVTVNDFVLGAGTILDPESARIAILEGADFIVSPALNIDTMKLCNRYRVLCTPGCMTVSEIVQAMECGGDIIKLFPGDSLGPEFLRAVLGPLPQAQLMPTGGVRLDNIREWLQAGAVALGVGTQIYAPARIGDYKSVRDQAQEFVDAVRVHKAELFGSLHSKISY